MPSARMSAPEKSPTSNRSRTARMVMLGDAGGLTDCARTPTSSRASPAAGPNERGAPFGGWRSAGGSETGGSVTGGSEGAKAVRTSSGSLGTARSRMPVAVSPGREGGGGIDGGAPDDDSAAGGGTESARSSVSGSSESSRTGHDEIEPDGSPFA